MLEHALWSPGHLTVRTIRDRREGHVVTVDRDGIRVAEGDDEGAIRATSGLVLAEALVAAADGPHGADGAAPVPGGRATAAGGPVPGATAPRRRTPLPRPTPAAPLWSGPTADPPTARPPASQPDTAGGGRDDPLGGDFANPVLIVDVFGERRGEVRVRVADESWRRRTLEADLLVDGLVVARLRTLGPWAEEAVVVAGGVELARLARFDHLRGVLRTVSAWDLSVADIPDERLRAVTVAAVLRLAKLRASAAEPAEPRRGLGRCLHAGRPAA